MKGKRITIGAITFLALSLGIALAGLEPPPYSLGIIKSGRPWLNKVFKGKLFAVTLELKSFKEPLTSAKIEFSLPPEVILFREGSNLSWSGDLDKNSEKGLRISMKSKTDWKEWSEPIKAHVEFICREWKIYRDLSWSHDGFKHIQTEWEKKKGVWKKKMEIDCNKKGNRLLCY